MGTDAFASVLDGNRSRQRFDAALRHGVHRLSARGSDGLSEKASRYFAPTTAPSRRHAVATARPLPRPAPVPTILFPSSMDCLQDNRRVLTTKAKRIR